MHTNAVSTDGREMPLLTVISETLKYIADKAIEKLTEQVTTPFKPTHPLQKIGKIVPAKIRWVLTVPALWSEEHKLFMRKATKEAGIINEVQSPNLLLCLEPEGASIQCREDAELSVRK